MKYFSLLLVSLSITIVSFAKTWRINNNVGVAADFTTFYDANNSANVHDGDSLYFEPSTADYGTNSMTVSKRLVVIGPGFLLDAANTSVPGNSGLQVSPYDARLQFFRLGAAASGTKFIGVTIAGSMYMNATTNITFERVFFTSSVYFETGANDNITFRKCFFNAANIQGSGTATISNFVCENNLFYSNGFVALNQLTGTGNLFRNNSALNGANAFYLVNTYIANNIFGTYSDGTFTNSTIKNNFFQSNQPLPGTATNNQVNVNMATIYVGGNTGSLDSRLVLLAASPAKGAGLTVASVVSPDCGAYGATDPYKKSGIPNIPSIYTLTVPTSIASGTATMNITFSTRNNN